jgi:hypothetical protein
VRASVRSSFEFLSMSTLDLFASMLGTFVLITFILLPYYLRQPSLESDVAQAQAEVSQSEDALRLYKEKLAAAQATREKADAQLGAAYRRLQAAQTQAQQPQQAAAPSPPPPTSNRKPGSIAIPDLDLVIVIDTTGSMRRQIRELQAGLLGVIRVLHRLSPSLSVAVVAYRDYGEAYVTRAYPLTHIEEDTVRGLLDFVADLRAQGGGDPPEAVEAGLEQAERMPWREHVMGRVVVIGDAPAHAQDWKRCFDAIARIHASARNSSGRTVGAIYTGAGDPEGRSFFERMAQTGGGDFRESKGELMESILLSVLKDAREE